MIFPLTEYNQHRSDQQDVGSASGSYYVKTYSGTPSDPWRIVSTVTTPMSGYAYRLTREMHDVVTPDFKRLRREGRIINSPMEQYIVQSNVGLLTQYRRCISRHGSSPNYYYTGFEDSGVKRIGGASTSWFYPSVPAGPNIDNLCASAIQDMWAKVSVKQNDTIASVGEMRETVASLISVFKRVIDIYRDIKKLRLASLYRKNISPKALAEAYMFYRYALRPLVFEAQSYVDVLCNKTILQRQTFRSYRTGETVDVAQNVTLADYLGSWKVTGSTEARRSVEIRGGVLCTLDITNNLGRWGITEPLEGVWELIPFSFIIDWFFNIGKYIAMWTPNFGIQKLASWVVVTDLTTLTSTVEAGTNYGDYNYTNIHNASGSYYKTILRKWRMPDPTRPTIPVWQVRLDWLKSLDIGIILKQLTAAKR